MSSQFSQTETAQRECRHGYSTRQNIVWTPAQITPFAGGTPRWYHSACRRCDFLDGERYVLRGATEALSPFMHQGHGEKPSSH